MKTCASLFGLLALSTLLVCAQDAKAPNNVADSKKAQPVTGTQPIVSAVQTNAGAQTLSGTPVAPGNQSQAGTQVKPPVQPATGSQAVGAGQMLTGGPAATQSSIVSTNEEKKPQVTVPRPTSKVLGKHVTYGGFFTDFVRAQQKRSFFDLKTPNDPQKDMDNLSFYPGTDQVQGVILFSIKF